MPLTNTDRRLLDELLAGHAGSWRQFVDRYTGLILQVIRQTAQAHSLKLSADDIEDLCAETIAELLVRDKAALRTCRGRCSLATWLAV
ncbi:MAG: sigma-70 family RNA polymerase sigma factor, partial [Planctomyces sp.]